MAIYPTEGSMDNKMLHEGNVTMSSPERALDGSKRGKYESSVIDERHAAASKSDDISGDAGDGGYGYEDYVNDPQVSEEDEPEKDVDCQAIYDRWDEEKRIRLALEAEEWAAKRNEPIQAHLEALHQAYQHVDPEYTVFAFGGTIPSVEVDAGKLTLHVARRVLLGHESCRFDGQMRKKVTVGKWRKKGARCPRDSMADFGFPLIGDKVEELCRYTSIAPFGKRNKSVVNLKYRNAVELTPDQYHLQPDPTIRNEDVLQKIASTLHMPCKLRAERAKLNIYRKGGFFRAHCDTPRSPNHIGTIVLNLPGAFQGGSLCVQHGGPKVKFDWGTPYSIYQESGLVPSTEIKWAFLYGDCEHSVKKVENGDRLTVAYDVFTIPDLPRPIPESQIQSNAIVHSLQEALADHHGFAMGGCTLAFGLSHSYPPTTEPFWKGLESRLKGPDAVLLQAVRRCNLEYSYKAAFQLGRTQGTDAEQYRDGLDRNLSNTVLEAIYRNDLGRYEVVLADRPDQVEGEVDHAYNEPTLFETLDHGAEKMPQIAWVDYPLSYGFRNDYEYMGNGPCDPEEAYSGVVMLVHIPPADKR